MSWNEEKEEWDSLTKEERDRRLFGGLKDIPWVPGIIVMIIIWMILSVIGR